VLRIAELEAKPGPPLKTSDNSGVPPSNGQRSSGFSALEGKANPRAGSIVRIRPRSAIYYETCARVLALSSSK
jgi:hypothetical protein